MKKLTIVPVVLALVLGACEVPEDPSIASTPKKVEATKKNTNTFTAGTYEVPKELKPGRYKTSGPDEDGWASSCYWARLKGLSGEFEDLIANGNLEGPTTITVRKTDKGVKFSGSCKWRKTK